MALDSDAWHMQLITLASNPGLMQRAAIRQLFTHVALEVDEIADACDLQVEFIREALFQIP